MCHECLLHKLKKRKKTLKTISNIKYWRLNVKIFKLGDTFSKGYHYAIEFENFSEFLKAK